MTILISARLIRYFRSLAVSMVGAGQYTAPRLIRAMVNVHHSGTRGSMIRTRSSLFIPYLISMLTIWFESLIKSQKVNFFSTPSWFTQIIASLFRSLLAQASITSKPKLKYSGTSIRKFLYISS